MVALCVGKDCRRHDDFRSLRTALDESSSDHESVKCLDCCRSPVVVLDPDSSEPTVIERVRSGRHRRALVAVVRDGAPLDDSLSKRVVTGKRRRTALRRLRKQR